MHITMHLWNEDEMRISLVGFNVNVDPANNLPEEFETRIKNQISLATGKTINKIPKLRCGLCSPSIVHKDKTRTSSKSLDIQCQQKDTKELIGLLQKTFAKNTKCHFVFHELRHRNLALYTDVIRRQSQYLSNSQTIPIHGVHEEVMFYLDAKFKSTPGITDVLRHKDTITKGRWKHLDLLIIGVTFIVYSCRVLSKAVCDNMSTHEVLHPSPTHWFMYVVAPIIAFFFTMEGLLQIPLTEEQKTFMVVTIVCVMSITFSLAKVIRDRQETSWL